MLRFQATELAEVLKRVDFSASKDPTRSHMCGVLFEQKEDQTANIVSTDGHRLTVLTFKPGRGPLDSEPEDFSIHVPLPMLKGVIGTPKPYDTITVSSTEVRGDHFGLRKYTDEFPFPPYAQIIPKTDPPNIIRFDRKRLIKTINALKKIAPNSESLAIRALPPATGGADLMMPADPVSGSLPETAPMDDCIREAGPNTSVTVKLNTKYFYEPLNKSAAEIVTVRFGAALDPVLMETSEEMTIGGARVIAERLCIVMPRR